MALWQVTLTGTILAQKCQNVLHFFREQDDMDNASIRNEFTSNWLPIVRNLQNASWAWTTIGVQQLEPVTEPLEVFVVTNQSGSLSGTMAPTVLAGLFSLRTGFAGRSGRGRFYLPGVHGASVLNSILEPNAFSAYQTRANDLLNRYGAQGAGPLRLVVASRGPERTFHQVTAIVVRQTFGIQRRRNIGVGS